MAVRAGACCLYEQGGTLLAAGMAMLEAARQADVVVTAFDRPGRVVRRCLLGGLHDVVVQLDGGAAVPAHVERVYFDPKLGRCCLLHLERPA